MIKPHVVCFDGYNFIHRARTGFLLGDWAVVYNFFRSFRAEVERHKPSRVVFVVEGRPKRQLKVDSSYKANRKQVLEVGSPEFESIVSFHRQKDIIINLLSENFPVTVLRHPDYEADDVIYNVVKRSTSAIPITLLSTDTDFIQMLDEFPNLKLYNPVKKKFVDSPEYDYVKWKSLCGDSSDNIPGVKGIGSKTAEKLVNDEELFKKKISSDPEKLAHFEKNRSMIRLHTLSEEQLMGVESNEPNANWDVVKKEFASMQFTSIIEEKAWTKFVKTFSSLGNN